MPPTTQHDEWPYWRHAYIPTSFKEFPSAEEGDEMTPGAYSGNDVLYFTRSPGGDDYARHNVTKLLFGNRMVFAYIQQPPAVILLK
mmetsp:Transcript_60447/g.70701  ORF Transcript_60447/g.70701 Transcript_60447/m.70701 type:complete len:86 (+) Transcript_60447:608-865(+)|eukprot:CAMPEP_0194371596 /NCGR_PEP_ID=MMETSP0174-20130528/20016_1 /TAXON_ID=216777 /ORGANISM="Proboscia alata, Strain PI-D3" /LENGTH=85 /DNA_ID=CAMNT_0039149757 /DNA_START=548 /DNA_END=805 /DNA_ORIENTATION=+